MTEDQQATIDRLVQETVEDGRKLVTVRMIDAIDDIPGADLIKVATVEGWKVVVRVGEFKPGDHCVFLEVDSFISLSDERFAFLEKNKITWHGIEGVRLKTIRLRKQISQGLALSLEMFPEIVEDIKGYYGDGDIDWDFVRTVNFTETLRVMKWEKTLSAQLAGQAKGNFPSFLHRSDQERAQNMGREIFGYEDELSPIDTTNIPQEALDAMLERGELAVYLPEDDEAPGQLVQVRKAVADRSTRYEVSIKLDGSSMTVYSRQDHYDQPPMFGVCSRNLELKLEGNEDNAFVKTAEPIIELLKALPHHALSRGLSLTNVALQGELMGPSVQSNREGLLSHHFMIYNIYDIVAGKFMTPEDRKYWIQIANEAASFIDAPKLEHVPVISEAATLEELEIGNMDDLLKFAEGPSMNHKIREGVVFKAVDGRHSFKVIANNFLEQEK